MQETLKNTTQLKFNNNKEVRIYSKLGTNIPLLKQQRNLFKENMTVGWSKLFK